MRLLDPVRTVDPAATPISLTEAKAHMRVYFEDDDALITALIEAAVRYVDGYEGILGRAMVTQTWRDDMPAFPSKGIDLLVGDVQSVTSIQYYDEDGDQQTYDAANYRLQKASGISYIEQISTASWPGVATRDDAISITYVAGFGDADAVPGAIKQALLLMVAHWYENREAGVARGAATEMPFGATALLAPWRRVGF
jgi:uncharacterized phiE125 gp8 family phage protein